jgi:deoxyribodipyrimidine photolyase-like uncharacterized protein
VCLAADAAHVAWAVNLACLGFHVWPYRADDPEHVDELRLDLDPQPGTAFAEARVAARELEALLDELGDVHPDELTLANVPARLERDGDPWAPIDDTPQSLEPLLALHERDRANGLLDARGRRSTQAARRAAARRAESSAPRPLSAPAERTTQDASSGAGDGRRAAIKALTVSAPMMFTTAATTNTW